VAATDITSHTALLTIPEARAALRLSERTFYRLMRRGDLQVVRLGRRTLVERSELDRLIESRRSPAASASGSTCHDVATTSASASPSDDAGRIGGP
jgi:excisionase family DNA binding protein